MSEQKRKIIQNFCHRFLKAEIGENESFTDILEMSPAVLKSCTEEEADLLSKYKITKIRNFLKLEGKDLDSVSEKTGIDVKKFRNWILASQLISRAWQKRNSYLKKEQFKIAVLGLDNAGKTSMLESLSGRGNITTTEHLEPTNGVSARRIESEKFNMIIWDFGGKLEYRYSYLQDPEEYFVQCDLIIFVVDIQDEARYDEAKEYFSQILEIMLFLNEIPYYLILLHKMDPDCRQDPKFSQKITQLKRSYTELLEENKQNFEIIESSIYNFYSSEPEFAKKFKSFFGVKKSKSLEESVEELKEMVAQLTNTIFDQFKLLQNALNAGGAAQGIKIIRAEPVQNQYENGPTNDSKPLPFNPPPIPNASPAPQISERAITAAQSKTALLNELKNVFKMRGITCD